MINKIIIMFTLCVLTITLIILLHKNFSRIIKKQGHVIIFDGASSAGKSSVIKELMPLLDNSYRCIAIDDFVTQVFLEQQKLKLPEKEFIARVNKQSNLMYDKIRLLVTQGKNVILDTVLSGLEGEKSIRDAFEKLNYIKKVMVLVHCPLPVLVERMRQRNAKALQENRPQDERSIGTAINQFGHIYKSRTKETDISLETISRKEVELACVATKKEFNSNLNRFEQFKEWLLTQLLVKDKEEVTLTTRLKYDCIIDTSKYTTQESAKKIKNIIINKR
jgi:chloramphenicol 3-O-phosphotransferase